jgi:cytochrome c oxidase subunit 1
LSSGGAILLLLGGLLLTVNMVRSLRRGVPAGDDPWGGETLEWATSSPPPVYNFLHIPVVEGRSALWERSPERPVVIGIRSDIREVLVTTVTTAQPSNKPEYPEPSIWPFLCAVVTSAFFVGSIFTAWAVPVAVVPLAVTLIGWFWPKHPPRSRAERAPALREVRA